MDSTPLQPKTKAVVRGLGTECWSCVHRIPIPKTDGMIRCDAPDTRMLGEWKAIREGRFYYPLLFDPIHKTRLCRHWEEE